MKKFTGEARFESMLVFRISVVESSAGYGSIVGSNGEKHTGKLLFFATCWLVGGGMRIE